MVLVSFFCNVPFFKIITVASYTVKNGLPYNFECLFVLAKNQLVVSTAFLIAIAMNIMSTPASIPHQSYTIVVFIATNHKSMYGIGSYIFFYCITSSKNTTMHTKQQTVINNNTAEGLLIQNAILWLGLGVVELHPEVLLFCHLFLLHILHPVQQITIDMRT